MADERGGLSHVACPAGLPEVTKPKDLNVLVIPLGVTQGHGLAEFYSSRVYTCGSQLGTLGDVRGHVGVTLGRGPSGMWGVDTAQDAPIRVLQPRTSAVL